MTGVRGETRRNGRMDHANDIDWDDMAGYPLTSGRGKDVVWLWIVGRLNA